VSTVNWSEEHILVASDPASSDRFGQSVDISADGGTLVVGTAAAEAAYVFVKVSEVWSEQQILVSLDAAAGDLFGFSVSISDDGDTVVSGATLEDGDGSARGAAYVFTRSGTTWTQEQKLTASDTSDGDGVGGAAALSGDSSRLLVGAITAGSSVEGLVYVFSLDLFDQGTAEYYTKGELGWGHVETINSDTSTDSDKFGQTVKLSDDGYTMAVAAPYRSKNNLANAGYVNVYELYPTWILRSEISLDTPAANDYFGYSIDLSKEGKVLAVGQYGKSVSSNAGAGSCSIYDKTQGEWTLTQTIDTPNPEASGNFGFSVAVSADGLVLAIGAPNEDALGTDDGRVYIYELVSGTWTLTQTIVLEGTSGAGNDLSFGQSVDLNEDGAILTAHQGDSTESGMLNVFIRHNDYWTPVFRKTSSDSNLAFKYRLMVIT